MLCLLLVVLVVPVEARKGVGISWDRESVIVNENQEVCIPYGIYNPWDEDVIVKLSLSPELSGVATSVDSEEKLVPANTPHNNSMPITLCFMVPTVYAKECMVADYLCKQSCSLEEQVFEGSVNAQEVKEGGPGGTGSATSLGVSVPLRLRVKCVAEGRDLTLLWAVILLVAVIGLIIILIMKRRKPSIDDKKRELEKLKKEIEEEASHDSPPAKP